MTGSEQTPAGPRPSKTAAERLAVIVDAAERAALDVIDDAEQEARRYLEEAQLQADRIVAQRLRETADLLERQRGGSVAEAGLRPLSGDPEPTEAEEAEAARVPFASAPDVDSGPRDDEEFEDEPLDPGNGEASGQAAEAELDEPLAPRPRGGSTAARLLATQMAVSGSTRKEIEMRLRNGFEIEDTDEILDAILGAEE